MQFILFIAFVGILAAGLFGIGVLAGNGVVKHKKKQADILRNKGHHV